MNAVHLAYMVHMILLGLTNDADYGASCRKNAEYPVVFICYFIAWLSFYCVVLYFYVNGFFMDKQLVADKDAAELSLEERLLEVGDAEDRAALDADGDGILDKL